MKYIIINLFIVIFSLPLWAQHQCDYTCSAYCDRYAFEMQRKANEIFTRCGTPNPIQEVELFNSDSCQGKLVGIVNQQTNCPSLTAFEHVDSIKIKGTCYDVNYERLSKSCELFKDGANPNATLFFDTDSCSGELIAIASDKNRCQTLRNTLTFSNWVNSINRAGQCHDTTNSEFLNSCQTFAP